MSFLSLCTHTVSCYRVTVTRDALGGEIRTPTLLGSCRATIAQIAAGINGREKEIENRRGTIGPREVLMAVNFKLLEGDLIVDQGSSLALRVIRQFDAGDRGVMWSVLCEERDPQS